MRHLLGITQPAFNLHALGFNGSTSYAEASNVGLPTAALSVSVWVRINQTIESTPAYRFVFDTVANYGFDLGKAGASTVFAIRARFSSSGITSIINGTVPVVQNTWYHLLATFDGTIFRAFVDGTQIGTASRSGETIVYNTDTPTIRMARYTSGAYLAMDVDELSIWDRAVAVNEVASANKPIDLTGGSGLVRWYRMGDIYVPGSFSIREEVSGTYPWTLFNTVDTQDFVAAP